ncbi:MAG: hypothetical protein E7572_05565 [Ruminococcaceae bacterium]|nr:hypothetical protein [Oscillospiraceae bacterium]
MQEKYGKNQLTPQKKQSFILKALRTICEPMFLLLLIAATIYFFLGEPRDGAIMLFVLICVFTYFDLSDHTFTARITESILSGVTLAMAMIPEEFPVILMVFLSMGA